MYKVRFMGDMAAFVGEKKDEPMSYPAPTPSAARSMIEAILWKPAIAWHIHKIHILNPIRWFTTRVNEVHSRMLDPRRPIAVDADRTQRRLTGLRDVDYVVEASYTFTPRRGDSDTHMKFNDMFLRRLELGQCRHQPYLGRRDFIGYFEPAMSDIRPAENLMGRTIHVGRMLLDRHYGTGDIMSEFFNAEIQNGVLVEAGKDCLPVFRKMEVSLR
jgi:CRISPR-associated protein Cas5d